MFGYNFAWLCFAILNSTPLNFTKHYCAMIGYNFAVLGSS